ncbi:MAG TPA: LacI family DNA-binding transcriptional regulator [Pengzhenrongella sp.]
MGDQVTIADLAGRLGISKASVSYALNDRPGVSPQTRERVRRLARELGWFPSSSARALARAKSGAIGLVLSRDPELVGVEPYYMRFLSGIEQVLIAADMALLLRMLGPEQGSDLAVYERWAGERRVDGVILVDAQEDDPRFPLMTRLGLPAVLHGGPVPRVSFPCVTGDDLDDAGRVVDHLRGLGHRHFALMTGPLVYAHEQRRQLLVRELAAEVGVQVDVVHGDYTLNEARRLAVELLRSPHRPTAIVLGTI